MQAAAVTVNDEPQHDSLAAEQPLEFVTDFWRAIHFSRKSSLGWYKSARKAIRRFLRHRLALAAAASAVSHSCTTALHAHLCTAMSWNVLDGSCGDASLWCGPCFRHHAKHLPNHVSG